MIYESLKNNIRRIGLDMIIAILLAIMFLTNFHEKLPTSMQLVTYKMMLISLGLVHAHISRKLIFGKIDWNEKFNVRQLVAGLMYLIFAWLYAQ